MFVLIQFFVCIGCMHGSEEIPHGREWIDKCNLCTCKEGILSCSAAPCVCSSHPAAVTSRGPRLSRDCCPQCDARNDCHHQELHHVIFHSGERWVYQCQTCECLVSSLKISAHVCVYIVFLTRLLQSLF